MKSNFNQEEKEGGLFDLPNQYKCKHPSHEPPTHLYIPPGKGYKHVCPGCKEVKNIIPPQISF